VQCDTATIVGLIMDPC